MPRIKDPSLSNEGKLKTEWAASEMQTLIKIKERFEKEKPLQGKNIACCMHVTSETANLMLTLKAAGAKIALAASNPLTTQDNVAAYLVSEGIDVYAIKGDDVSNYENNLKATLEIRPHMVMDDGGDLTVMIHKDAELLSNVIGGAEETTTGVIRLENMAKDGKLKYPVVAVNDSLTKQMFDNRYGTGQSTIDGILRATNILIAGKNFVVGGYGWCGKGVSLRAKGLGASVIVTEVDPVKALEAVMEGFRVMPMNEAAKVGDIFVTVTGGKHIINTNHMKLMKDKAILANSGHFDIEIDVEGLRKIASSSRDVRTHLKEYIVDRKKIYLLAEGRLVNSSAAEGHPAAVMDMSFADQALACEYILNNELSAGVHRLPESVDRDVAAAKLESMGIRIDKLSETQTDYANSWSE
ncbi:MAG: adenosylhomocysteinase [Candidatus Altiarchaeota archaeon]|nr:adenosylhomocysteinase [Candidatus Altiarchaeota archaeon]